MKTEIYALIKKLSGQNNVLVIPRFYIDLTGNIYSALLLSQIIYWSERNAAKNGWFAKSYDEWTDELSLSKYLVSKAMKTLYDFGVETKVEKFKGAPTVHYRVDQENLTEAIVKKLHDGKLKDFTIESENSLRTYTETTTETPTETTKTTIESDSKGGADSENGRWVDQSQNDFYKPICTTFKELTGIEVDEMDVVFQWITTYSGRTVHESLAEFARALDAQKAKGGAVRDPVAYFTGLLKRQAASAGSHPPPAKGQTPKNPKRPAPTWGKS